MEALKFSKAGLSAVLVTAIALISWESHLRHKHITVDYDDDQALWSDKRAMVYEPADQATVFIGSSRIKYDLDIPTWEKLTGDHAIQLAMVGSSPRQVLKDLANDIHFKGRVAIDVTEQIFFSDFPNFDIVPNIAIGYYKKRSPSQRFSFFISRALESKFVFLDNNNFSLGAMLTKLQIPDRRDFLTMPIFPMGFGRVSFDRQSHMTREFLADTNQQNQVKGIWSFYGKLAQTSGPPPSAGEITGIFNEVKNEVDKIRARGGEVIFLRTPSSGPVLQFEAKAYSRSLYWDRLLAVTHAQGVYFADYPAISHFQCPEFSHLAPTDAITFTKNLAVIFQKEKGWAFKKTVSF